MRIALSLLLLAAPAVSWAQEPAADAQCTGARPALPAALASWNQQTPLAAAADARGAGEARVGRAFRLALHPADHVKPSAPSPRPVEPGRYAGLVRIEVPAAGRYRVALGAGAWIDVVANGRSQPSVAHGHGPQCSGIRKMVDFDLKPGRYLIQLTDAKAATLPLMVAKL